MNEQRILGKEDVAQLNKEGHKLDGSKFYVLNFLFNDKLNNAANPGPFQVHTDALDSFAKKAIGKPWIVPEYGEKNHIGFDKDTIEGMISYQAKYAIGVIQDYIRYPSNNVWGIVEVFPEYVAAVKNNMIPPFNSISITLGDPKQDIAADPVIRVGDVLNLQAVPAPGYPKELAGHKPVCEGGMTACMQELKAAGAAGRLKKVQNSKKLLYNIVQKAIGAMSAEPAMSEGGGDGASSKEIMDGIKTLQEQVQTVQSQEQAIVKSLETNNEVLKEVATATDGVDENKVIVKPLEAEGSGEGEGDAPPMDPPMPAGAAGKVVTVQKPKTGEVSKELAENPTFKQMKQELDDIKRQLEKERKDNAQKERLNQATRLVENKLKTKDIEVSQKDETIKAYVNLKDAAGNLRDLTLLLEETDKQAAKVVGASGTTFIVPNIDSTKSYNNTDMMEAMKA